MSSHRHPAPDYRLVVNGQDITAKVNPRLINLTLSEGREGAADTLECLESLLRSDIPLRVAVVDNASADGSDRRIIDWASG